MSPWDDFRKSLKTWQTGLIAILAFLSLVTGALGDIIGLLSFIPAPYLGLAKVALLYFGAIILVWLFTYSILTKRERVTGITKAERDPLVYSLANRRLAWFFRVLFLLFIIPFFLRGFRIKEELVQTCVKKSQYTGLLIAKFSDKPDDQFSFHLYEYLSGNLRNDTIKIAGLDQQISLKARDNIEDSLSPFLECYKNGVIVYGSRSINEQSFLCGLYSRDVKTKGQHVILLPESPSIKLPIDVQTDLVGKFVLAQLNYKLGNNQQSQKYVDTLLQTALVQKDSALKAFCFLYQGLNQLQSNQTQESIKSFELASNFDKTRPEIQNAISYMRTLKAFEADPKQQVVQPKNFAEVINNSNILIKKGFVVNDSIGYTISDYRGFRIKDTVLPYQAGKFVILPSSSKYYAIYLGKDAAFQLGNGRSDSLQATRWLDSMKTNLDFRKNVLTTEANIKNWERINQKQQWQ